jgi:hypothetical protein
MKKLMDDFELDEIQAAGILGNIGHECAGFHIMHEIGQPEGKGGYGWAQWTGPRRKAFFVWCGKNKFDVKKGDWKKPQANYGFLKNELNTTHTSAISALHKTHTVEAATNSFERHFEGAGIPHMESRQEWAAIALDAFRVA